MFLLQADAREISFHCTGWEPREPCVNQVLEPSPSCSPLSARLINGAPITHAVAPDSLATAGRAREYRTASSNNVRDQEPHTYISSTPCTYYGRQLKCHNCTKVYASHPKLASNANLAVGSVPFETHVITRKKPISLGNHFTGDINMPPNADPRQPQSRRGDK